MKLNRGFSLIEIIISLAILAVIFLFIFYFLSTIMRKGSIVTRAPYMPADYNYSNVYCHISEDQIDTISLRHSLDMSAYVSTSTPITSISVFNKNRLILTTNSASTTESDIFLFSFDIENDLVHLELLQSLNIGPGLQAALLHDTMVYALDTSINSHVRTVKINMSGNSLSSVSTLKIGALAASGAMPKRIYLYNKNLLIGTEKNNAGGELFMLPLDSDLVPKNPAKSTEVGGQVSGIYESQGNIFVANASDTEMFVYDKDFELVNSYDAPLSLGNGKSVYYLEPYIYLGRTVSSFELFFLEMKDNVLEYINKFKANGSIDFIQRVDQDLLIISSAENRELQLYSKKLDLLKTIDLPGRVNEYNCFDNGFLFSTLINNQPNLLWLK